MYKLYLIMYSILIPVYVIIAIVWGIGWYKYRDKDGYDMIGIKDMEDEE